MHDCAINYFELTEELPGVQDGQTFEYDPGGSRWGYDTLGNWATLTDSTIAYDPQIPDPFDDASAEVEDRGHNSANELTALDPGGQSEKLFDYDDAGNMVRWERPGGVERKLVYDAWNRVAAADDLWDCVGDVVSGCETAFANGLLGSTVGGVAVDLGDLVKRWKEDLDIGVKRDKMRELARHILH